MENIFHELNEEQEQEGASDQFITELKEIEIDKPNITCSICLDEFSENEKCIKLPCKDNPHYFHSGNDKCPGIIEWLKKSNTCPMCRTEFPKERRLIRINIFQLLNSIHHINIDQILEDREEEIMRQVLENSLNDQ